MQGIRYYDLRQVRGYGTRIDIDNGAVEEAGTSFFDDTVIRALGPKGWGVVTMDSFVPDAPTSIENAIAEAAPLTAVTHEDILLAGVPGPVRAVPALREDPAVIHLDEKIDLLHGIERAARVPEVGNTRATYLERKETVRFMDSSGIDISYDVTRCGFSVMAVAVRQGRMQMGRESRHTISGFNLRHQEGMGEKAGRTAVALLDAVPARGKRMNVVLDQELGGVFAHEAVGHASEGDLIKEGNSVLRGKIGETIGNRDLTIIDDPTLPEFGFEPLDAEGMAVHRTEVIQGGKVHAYLHNRETAPVVGNGEPGNARAMAGSIPQVRMSNTFIENGDIAFEELLEVCGTGILLKGSRGGQVDPGRGVFLFNAEYGYLIENGECTTMVRDVSLSGEILSTLHDIELIGNDRLMYEGFCGKGGQSVPVSDGAPHLLLRHAVVGGSGTD
ncbi:MAG: TldD/PmbA family protein [Methanomicrobiales archaeon]|nr:TldD/PmbA family protein [Methanomicrobiales archaeon]